MQHVWELVSKPDNIPIVALLVLVIVYTWWSFARALRNDRQGFLTEERLSEKIQVWPNLVRVEFLAALFVMVILVFWSFLIDAPLEEAANPTLTPNPSKAPWYFLGLQELLKMFNPMVAGVLLPGIALVVLAIVPFIDKNPSKKPDDRKFAITMMTMFLMMWAVLVIIGCFFRGPGFNFTFPWDKQGIFFEL